MIKTEITREDINELVAHDHWPAVSITIATVRTGTNVHQAHIRLKNDLAAAETRLIAGGMRRTVAVDFLAGASALIDNAQFWDERLDAVAIYIADGFFRAFHLPFHLDDSFDVSHSFNVLPLTPAFTTRAPFNILVLDKHHVRLVRCSERSAINVKVEGLVTDIEAFGRGEHKGDSHQQHTVGGGGNSVIGPGGTDHDALEKARARRHFISIDHAVGEHLKSSKEPLILAGTRDAQGIYRDIAKYPHILEQGLIATSKAESNDELRAASRPILDAVADAPRTQELDRYRAQAGTGLTSQQIEEILVAADAGKIESLLIAGSDPIWGKFDDVTGVASVNDVAGPTDENLVNRAALGTLRHKGSVFAVRDGELDLVGSAAAVFRY